VTAVFTTRMGGVSCGAFRRLNLGASTGDDPGAVRENRRRLAGALGVDPERVTMAHQVPRADVRRIDAPTRPGRFTGGLSGWPEGDGLVTDAPGLALAVLAADCLPVLLWRRDRPRVAAVHAGWRGLVGGILEAAVAALGEADRVAAAVGPGIAPCCYPTGEDVRARFAERFGTRSVRGDAVDLAGAARQALVDAGLPADGIGVVSACTSCEASRFFSHRRDGSRTGRQAGVVWIAREELPRDRVAREGAR
jgi:YfiH family protein